jgi:hypothetical protein
MKVLQIVVTILIILVILFVVAVLGLVVMSVIDEVSETEVETYVVGMEVVEKDYSTHYVKYEGTKHSYIINAIGSGEEFVMEVSESEYAHHAVGDIIYVEVKVLERNSGIYKEYKILHLENIKEKEE